MCADPLCAPSSKRNRDHDTEEEAARAFDRAAINKAGAAAQTNYPLSDYEREMEALRRVSASELVATLRAKARRHGTQTSQYRGVSLLKQTGKWHGQINVGGKQLHLGFFGTEELAARAYDRAAIHKAGAEGGVVVTNLDISLYANEIERLQSMTREELMAMLAEEKRCESAASGKTTTARRRIGSDADAGATRGAPGGDRPDVSGTTTPPEEGSAGGSGGSGSDLVRVGGSGSDLVRVGSGPVESALATAGDGARDAPRSFRSSSSGETHHDGRDRGDSPTSEGHADKPVKDDTPEMTSSGEGGGSASAVPPALEVMSKTSRAPHAGTKRGAPQLPPSPRAPGKQRRTKQPPRQAPCAA
jgi:hypothetical protein